MWLISAPTAVALLGAAAGILLVGGLTELSPLPALVIGGIGGSAVASAILLGPSAERFDRRLHRMGGARGRRRRRGPRS